MTPTYTIFDLETTGFSPTNDRIIQIAAVQMRNGRLLKGTDFFTYVDPEIPIPWFISKYTGIRDRDVMGAPLVFGALIDFAVYAENTILIAHNGHSFDMRFLAAQARRYVNDLKPALYHDSLHLSRMVWPGEPKHSLDAVKSRLGLTHSHRRHDARGDVEILGNAVIEMCRMIRCCRKPLDTKLPLYEGGMIC